MAKQLALKNSSFFPLNVVAFGYIEAPSITLLKPELDRITAVVRVTK